MSVQRVRWDPNGIERDGHGPLMFYADHARIVAEMEARAGQDGMAMGYKDGYEQGKADAAAPRTLTADDPEPAVGSVVLDGLGQAWQRSGWNDGPWFPTDSMVGCEWPELARVPITLIHDGEAGR